MKNEITLFENQNVKLEVNMKDETVWLTQAQMAELFWRDIKKISKHIINAFKEELDEKSNSQKMRIANSDKLVNKLVKEKEVSVFVTETDSKWLGITYLEDKEKVVAEINKLIATKKYPLHLWK